MNETPSTPDDLNATLSAWEPEFELRVLPAQGRLYEPDGTLYAILLAEHAELLTDRRRQPIRRGDLAIVPQSVAVEVEPEADFLGFCVSGSPPYHFRERFIQVQGFEHVPASSGTVLDDEARHRVGYRIVKVAPTEPREFPLPPGSRSLVVVLDGQVASKGQQEGPRQASAGEVFLTEETARLVLEGSGTAAIFVLSTSEIHLARRLTLFASRAGAISPETSGRPDRGEIST